MKTLKPQELRSIEQFFQLTQSDLIRVLRQYLKSKYEQVYCTKDYLVAIGEIPVAIVAHLDTVFSETPNNIFYDRQKNVMWSPEGLGADDRAGVYSIVQIIKKGFRPTIIFTTDEERGAIGANKLVKDISNCPTELKYIIQLDRRGSDDCVFYDCENPKFEAYVESFGFVTNFGTFSDISVICPKWKVAGVNLSIGYYNEHSYTETLYIGQMLSTISKVVKMLEDIENAEKYEYIEASYLSYYRKHAQTLENNYDWDPSYGVSKAVWNSWHTSEEIDDNEIGHCHFCSQTDYEYNLFPVKNFDGKTIFLCCDCASQDKRVRWCGVCEEGYILEENATDDYGLCCDCLNAVGGSNDTKSN